jgi:hypothetical protein
MAGPTRYRAAEAAPTRLMNAKRLVSDLVIAYDFEARKMYTFGLKAVQCMVRFDGTA